MTKQGILKDIFGYDTFRPGQEALIDALMAGQDAVGIMPTGAGKSLCYQIPALLLPGVTLVISPLISLMKDQVGALTQAGVPAAFINSSLSAAQQAAALRQAENGRFKIIYVAPERLTSPGFEAFVRRADIAAVMVDEAHCVSQWGHDFRPGYLDIRAFIDGLEGRPVVGAFTATATAKVREDIIHLLALWRPHVLVTGFDRPNLHFSTRIPADKNAELLNLIAARVGQAGIVYCSTRAGVEDVCDRLRRAGHAATRYHAGLEPEERQENQNAFVHDDAKIMVATNAFGMGIDKSNVAFVIHYNMPKNVESYYQEAGRAGRDGGPADCILLYSPKDVQINRFLIQSSREAREELDEAVRAARVERDLELLRAMTVYATTTECLRRYILHYFGEQAPLFCGHCGNCNDHYEVADITEDARKIISCVVRIERMGRSAGKGLLAQILRGKDDETLRRTGYHCLPTFGIMADKPLRTLRYTLDHLVAEGYLGITDGPFPVLCTTEKSAEALRGQTPLSMRLPQEKPKAPPKAPKGRARVARSGDRALFDKLAALRLSLAHDLGVPAYVIFSDATLWDMCHKMPHSKAQFLEVSGVGHAKLGRFGAAFMAVIQDHEQPRE